MSRIPAAIEKLPKVVKTETKTSLTWSAASRPSCLAFCSSSPSGASAGAAAATTRSVAPAPEVSSPRLETSTWRIWVGRPSRRCAPSSGISTDAPSRARPVVVDDGRHARGGRPAVGEHAQPVAGARSERVRRVTVEVDLARLQVRERHGLAAGRADRAEAAELRGVGGEQRHARLGAPARRVLHRDGLDDRRRDAVDQPGPPQRALDRREGVLREVVGVRRRRERRGALAVGAADRHQLVGPAQRLDHRGADGAVHRVAGHQRGRDDRRAEHQPGDDQRRAAGTPGQVAQPEAQQEAVAQRAGGHDADREAEGDAQPDGQVAHRDAEEPLHR